jgi:pyridoxamine 5'-phosphate oxidase
LKDVEELKVKADNGEHEVKRPDWWGGYRIIGESFEFWQGQRSRIHDRFLYKQNSAGEWEIAMLSP